MEPPPAKQEESQGESGKGTPIHTVFMVNFPFNITDAELHDFVSEYGEVQNIFSLIPKRGIAFITYYDIRAAERAVKEAHGRLIGVPPNQRDIRTNYAYRPPSYSRKDLSSTCSTVLVKGSNGDLLEAKIREALSTFGEIRSIAETAEKGAFMVKYYDLRGAKAAVDASGKLKADQSILHIEYKLGEDEGGEPSDPSSSHATRDFHQQGRQSEHGDFHRRTFDHSFRNFNQQQYVYQQAPPAGYPPGGFYPPPAYPPQNYQKPPQGYQLPYGAPQAQGYQPPPQGFQPPPPPLYAPYPQLAPQPTVPAQPSPPATPPAGYQPQAAFQARPPTQQYAAPYPPPPTYSGAPYQYQYAPPPQQFGYPAPQQTAAKPPTAPQSDIDTLKKTLSSFNQMPK